MTSWRNSTRLDLAAGASDWDRQPHVEQLRPRREVRMNAVLFATVTILVATMIATTLAGNLLVCLAVLLVRKLRHPSNYLLVSLAVSDFFVGCFIMPLAYLYLVSGKWVLGDLACTIWTSADVTLCTASILNLCVINVDKYLAISRPLSYRRTGRRTLLCIAFVWIGALTISVLPIFAFSESRDEAEDRCIVSQNIFYQIYATMGSFYVPTIIMLLVNYKILKAARRLSLIDYGNEGGSSYGATKTMVQQKNRAVSLPSNPPSAFIGIGNNLQKRQQHRYFNQEVYLSEKEEEEECDDVASLMMKTDRRCSFSCPPCPEQTSHPTLLSSDAHDHQHQKQQPQLMNDAKQDIVAEIAEPPEHVKTNLSSSFMLSGGKHHVQGGCGNGKGTFKIVRHSFVSSSSASRRFRIPLIHRTRPFSRKSSDQKQKYQPKKQHKKGSHEDKALKTLGVIMGAFIVCWLPFFILALIGPFCHGEFQLPEWLDSVVLWLGYFNSTLNPMIYAKYNRDFRVPFREMLCCRFATLQSVMRTEMFSEKFGPPESFASMDLQYCNTDKIRHPSESSRHNLITCKSKKASYISV